ncbi:MAG: methylmalonyl Co-A mutase-associated GTPase MeaB [Bacteroidetes bacterium]|nr:methylmalonyl Co-A mutase-associated GTPase MeaB [Bacteroidota bacterium]MCY4205325.1 methylmalonyl Co-A mutase-associated GTPase MeaB [Bacteroidota bacterium]
MPRIPDIDSLVNGILLGDRTSLSQGITLIESTLESHLEASEQLLKALLPNTGNALRVAVTGAPGVGKSTFIEVLGTHLVDSGNRVAVLPIDPSSPQTGGSILGDKTRMQRLAKHPNAFIRPSPSGANAGGVTHTTRSVMQLCEAAGYNPILIETVGAGQGDYAVREITDLVLLLVLAHAGDELQGIKRGILETADLIAVTKADGEFKEKAFASAKVYRQALSLYSNRLGIAKVLISSAHSNKGIAETWEAIRELEGVARSNGHFERQRQEQIKSAVLETAKILLLTHFGQSVSVQDAVEKIQMQVMNGECTIDHAANQLLDVFRES